MLTETTTLKWLNSCKKTKDPKVLLLKMQDIVANNLPSFNIGGKQVADFMLENNIKKEADARKLMAQEINDLKRP